MKKDLNIVMNGETLVLDQESMVEVKESRPSEIHTGSLSGRIGYVHVCEDGEELRKPEFEIIEYETDKDCIQLDC